ncbi:MAG: ATP-binding protein [Deinococcales bacterium]
MRGIGARIAGIVIAVTLVTVLLGVALQLGAWLRERSQLPAPYRPQAVLMWPFGAEHGPRPGVRGGMMMQPPAGVGGQPTVPEVRALLTEIAARRLGTLLVTIVLSLAVGGVLAWWLARRLGRPIAAVSSAAQRVARGDLSARVALPGWLERSHDETAELARDFNTMAAHLEGYERERRALIADVAHELRNPLTILRGRLEAMEDGIAPLTVDEVRNLHDQTLLLGRLVEDLRILSLVDSGRLEVTPRDVDVAELLRRTVQGFEPHAAALGVTVGVETPATLTAGTDPERLVQVVTNLVDNALRVTPPEGRVMVRLERQDGGFRIEVADPGPGLAPGSEGRVFERFYRADASRSRSSGGSGLGLSIVKALVELHGGSVTATNRPEGGASFVVVIPGPAGAA